jgi:hypothetical protein
VLEDALGPENVQFVICSDGKPDQLQGLVDRNNAVFASGLPNSDVSDLLALINTDMLICSISSFSMWAAFLSRAPYVWYRPNLIIAEGGLANRFIQSLGIHASSKDLNKSTAGRGVALSIGDPIPGDLLDHLRILLINKMSDRDIVKGGAIDCAYRKNLTG